MIFVLRMGDWSNDGHGKYFDVVLNAETSFEQINAAYAQVYNVTGIDIDSLCVDYGENEIAEHIWDRLHNLGYNINVKGYPTVNKYELSDIVVFLLNIVNPNLKLEIIEVPYLYSSAGYGLLDDY